MITKENIIETFGTKTNAAKTIGITRPTLDDWLKKGKVPEYCTKGRGNSSQKDWDAILTKKGIDIKTLKPL